MNGENYKKASRVYVTQDNGTVNTFPALRYGEIRVFTRKELPILGDAVAEWLDELEYWLDSFNPRTDYLLLLGDPVLMAATAFMIGKRHDTFNVLKWDRQEKVYNIVTIYSDL